MSAAIAFEPVPEAHHVGILDSLHAVWITAELTLTEAVRRRFWLAGILICAFYVALGFFPIHPSPQRRAMLGPLLDQFISGLMATYGAEMIEFFCFLFAVALAAGAISAELERGTLAVIVPKPLPRWSIYVGKLLGVNLFLIPMLIVLTSLLQWAIWMHVQKTIPSLWRSIPVMYLYPLLFSSLTLFFSSFAGNLLATIMPLIMASTAWAEGILKNLGYFFDISSLKTASKIVVYVVPLNPMSRWLERSLDFDVLQKFFFNLAHHPYPTDPPAGSLDMAWVLGYTAVFFVAGLVIFQRRDL